MRRAALAAIAVGCALATSGPAAGFPSIAFVQKGAVATGSGATITATLPSPSTAGDLLVATIIDINSNCSTDSFSGPSGWIEAAQSCRSATGPVEIWYRPNAPAGVSSVAFDTGSSGANTRAQLSEYSGADTASPLDQKGTANSGGTSGTSLTVATSGAVAAPGEVGVSVFSAAQGLSSFAPGSGWTSLVSDPADGLESDYTLAPTRGSTLSESVASTPQSTWGAVLATFAPPCTRGSLSLGVPGLVSFPGVTLAGTDLTSVTTSVVTPDDETGNAAGWNITATSTTFTNAGGKTLPTDATTLTSASAAAATGNCTLPTNSVAYPLTLPAGTSAPAAVKLFDAAADTGAGPASVTLDFSVAVPANSFAGSYTSTWTLAVVAGP